MDVAQLVGHSPKSHGLLSTIERGIGDFPVTILWRLSRVLEVPLPALVDPVAQEGDPPMLNEPQQHFRAMLDSMGLVIHEERRLLERVEAQLAHLDNLRLLMLDWLEQQRDREENVP
jgi:hypothetical protein